MNRPWVWVLLIAAPLAYTTAVILAGHYAIRLHAHMWPNRQETDHD